MQAAILQVSYLSCLGAYLVLSVMVAAHWKTSKFVSAVLLGSLTTAMWAGVVASQSQIDNIGITLILEIMRPIAWLYFLSILLGITQNRSLIFKRTSFLLIIACALGLIIFSQPSLLGGLVDMDPISRVLATTTGFMGLTILGLLMLENLYRNSDSDNKWALKYLCFGLGAILIYDFLYYAEIILYRTQSIELFQARGFINALAAPLIGVAVTRAKTWSVNIHVTRNVVLHTTALIVAGIYLLLMAGAGYYVRTVGGNWGTVLQITLSAGALLLLLIVLSSSSLRGRLQRFISRNFFSTKYDYRAEWLRFSKTISYDNSDTPLHKRLLDAVAHIVDSRAAALWVYDPVTDRYDIVQSWNFGDDIPAEQSAAPLIHKMKESADILEMRDIAPFNTSHASTEFTTWLCAKEHAWLTIPIHHHHNLIAFIVLGDSRAAFEVDWADRELLTTVAEQAASYLAEEQSANALTQAKQFEDFNKRFAFVVHDLKNVINQLSLIVKNAESHGHKPEFQKDMLETVSSSVTRMNQLLTQLTDKRGPVKRRTHHIALHTCLQNIAEEWCHTFPTLRTDLHDEDLYVKADENRLIAAIGHLIQNAIDATSGTGTVTLQSSHHGQEVHIDIIDDGPGMTHEFVRDELFRPMASTKDAGFGVGVYQVREYIYGMGGAFKVETQVGHGTRMRIILTQCQPPLAAE